MDPELKAQIREAIRAKGDAINGLLRDDSPVPPGSGDSSGTEGGVRRKRTINVCQFIDQDMECPYGDKCRFRHSQAPADLRRCLRVQRDVGPAAGGGNAGAASPGTAPAAAAAPTPPRGRQFCRGSVPIGAPVDLPPRSNPADWSDWVGGQQDAFWA